MAGLLGNLDDPQNMGMLQLAAGLLGTGSFGDQVGRGLQGYQAAQSAGQAQQRDRMALQRDQMQMDALKQQAEQERQYRELVKSYQLPATPATGGGLPASVLSGLPAEFQTGQTVRPMPAQPARFDREGFASALEGVDPMRGLTYRQAIQKDNTPITVAPGASLVDKNTFKPVFTAPKEANVPAEEQGYYLAQGQGYKGSFLDYQKELKKAGATNVSTKVETKMGDSLAGQIGPMVKDTYNAAQGAVQQADAAGRIIRSIDSGKIIAGPAAGLRMKASQIGQLLGVTGKDDAETIARSRDVIRGLAEMTLQGRKQMTGQGSITESEGKLAEKANSGNIEDLTPAEIKQLARASLRAAKFIYQVHTSNLQTMRENPDTAKLSLFYKVPPLPAVDVGDAPAAPTGPVKWGDLK